MLGTDVSNAGVAVVKSDTIRLCRKGVSAFKSHSLSIWLNS